MGKTMRNNDFMIQMLVGNSLDLFFISSSEGNLGYCGCYSIMRICIAVNKQLPCLLPANHTNRGYSACLGYFFTYLSLLSCNIIQSVLEEMVSEISIVFLKAHQNSNSYLVKYGKNIHSKVLQNLHATQRTNCCDIQFFQF